jgi:Kef-type K+ transport system membrane component KefB
MPEPHFTNLLLVAAVAFAAPFLLGLAPSVRLPSVVLEILAGIVIGPAALGWAKVDEPVAVLSLLGLAFLLFLAGLEIDFARLRGRLLRLSALGYVLSFAISLVVALLLKASGLIETPLLIAIILASTSLGVIIPVLKDAGEVSTGFGQLVIAGATIADFGAIILLSIFFSGEGGTGSTVILLASFALLGVVTYLVLRGAERSMRISRELLRLQDTTAQIRVRGAVVLMVAFAALADTLGLEVILGAFAAGAILTLVDSDQVMTHPLFRRKLDAIGYGVFIPVFFVTTGLRFDLDALLASGRAIVMIPIFLAALLVVRGLPALLLYRRLVDRRRAAIAGLLHATSLPFIVAASAIGIDLGLLTQAESAALIAAGLLSVVIFPVSSLALLRRATAPAEPAVAGADAGPGADPEREIAARM